MHTSTVVVDNRLFLLGLDELYRGRMKEHERGELLHCARAVSQTLHVSPKTGPVEGYYSEDELLTEYFQRMRALQEVPEESRPQVDDLPEFQRLLAVTSAPLYGEAVFDEKLLPSGMDPLSKALKVTFPAWTVDELTSRAFSEAMASDDFSLVGLAALAQDPILLAALRETVVLYAAIIMGGVAPATVVYEWQVDPLLAARAARFVSAFNELFDEHLPVPTADNAATFAKAANEWGVYGRCVRLGSSGTVQPVQYYHWAVTSAADGQLAVRDFWSTELWTTERFREALGTRGPLPFQA